MGSATKRHLHDVGAGSFAGRVFGGARAVFSGIGLVFSDARLLALSLVPMVVHVGLFALFLWLGFSDVVDPIVDKVGPDPGDAGAFASVVGGVVRVVAVVVVVVVALLLSVLVGSVACDPFYDLLSERTEELFVGRNVGPPFSLGVVVKGVAREALATLLRLCVYGAVAVPLWLLSFTPAALVATPLSFVWTWLFFAYEYVSRSLARHAVRPEARFKPIFSNKALFCGFGCAAWIASFVPFLAPVLVVAATRLYLALAAHERVPSLLSGDEKQLLKG